MLTANKGEIEANAKALAKYNSLSPTEKVSLFRKALAHGERETASGMSDINSIRAVAGKFIDITVRKDNIAYDFCIRASKDAEDTLYWNSSYNQPVGVTVSSIDGTGPGTLYAKASNRVFIPPDFSYDAAKVMVPRFGLNIDEQAIGLYESALAEQADALKLYEQNALFSVLCSIPGTLQPMGQDIVTSLQNYAALSNVYLGKTVYVLNPGVQPGTRESTNVISVTTQGGFTNEVFLAMKRYEVLSGRKIVTVYAPKIGFPWEQLIYQANSVTVVNPSITSGGASNPALVSVPAAIAEKRFNMDPQALLEGEGMVVQGPLGMSVRFKCNNFLPQGLCVFSTDQPAAVWYDVTNRSQSVEIESPLMPYMKERHEKRTAAIAAPHPWSPNWGIIQLGNSPNHNIGFPVGQ